MSERPEHNGSSESKKTRPVVRLVDYSRPVENESGPHFENHNIDIFDTNGNAIGSLKLEIRVNDDQKSARIYEITLKPEFIGKSFGKAAYLELLKFLGDTPLISSTNHLNDYSTKIWESLIRDGLAEEEYIEVEDQSKLVGYRSIPKEVKQHFNNE
jgi:hypothetical protein